MKRFALGLFLALALPFAPQAVSAQTPGNAGAPNALPEEPAQGIDLQQVNAAIESDRSALADSRADADDLRAVIWDDESQVMSIRQRLAGGEAALPRIQSDLSRAKAAVDAERAAFEPVRARYEAARTKLEAARNDARAELERSPEFREVADAESSAANARRAAEDAAARRLLQTETGRRKQVEIDKWSARIAYFQQAGPAFERDRIAAASRVQDARWELNELRARYLDGDPAVRAAREKAAAADAAVARLRAENETQLASAPAVAEAGQALAAEFGPYNAALAVLRHAESRVAAIRAAYDATVNGMAADREALASIQDELAHARADLTQVNDDIDRISLDLTNALAAADQAGSQSAPSDADVSPLEQPVLAWTDGDGLLPRRGMFPARFYARTPRLECQTVLVTNWAPQPIFIEPTYLFVSGQTFGRDWRQHWAHHHPEHSPQHPNHVPFPGTADAAGPQRLRELQATRSSLRSREAATASGGPRMGRTPSAAANPPVFTGGNAASIASPAAPAITSAPSQPAVSAQARPASARPHR